MPAGFTLACQMVGRPFIRPVPDQMSGHVGNQARRCRRTGLVSHDRQLLTLRCQPQDSFQEIAPVRSEYPTGPHNHRSTARGTDGFLSGPLALAINRQWMCGIGFVVRSPGQTVKHVIRRIVHQPCLPVGGPLRQHPRQDGIHLPRSVRLLFGQIHSSPGGSIDDQPGPESVQQRQDRQRLLQIGFVSRDGQDLAERRQGAPQLETDLSVGSGQQDPGRHHAAAP